jgi:hypothetical protein
LFAYSINGQSRLQKQDTILDIGVGPVIYVPFELPVTTTTKGLFMFPNVEIKLVEVFVEH